MFAYKNNPNLKAFKARRVKNYQTLLDKKNGLVHSTAMGGLISKSKSFAPFAMNIWVAALCLSATCYLNAN